MSDQRIGFVGAGQMATALARGFVQAGFVEPQSVVAFDPYPAALERFTAEIAGTRGVASNLEVVQASDTIFLAVKPQHVTAAMQDVRSAVTPGKLFVSVIAGTPIAKLAAGLGTERIVRVMPNTPCLIGQGASAFSPGPAATPADCKHVADLMNAVGVALPLGEPLLDAVTGLSGSGPAFVYLMIEALSDAGVRVGLPRATAATLAAQTVRGAAEMVLTTGEHPAVLKDRVASPGGTTIAGLEALESHAVRGALIAAVVAATRRSQELGQS